MELLEEKPLFTEDDMTNKANLVTEQHFYIYQIEMIGRGLQK